MSVILVLLVTNTIAQVCVRMSTFPTRSSLVSFFFLPQDLKLVVKLYNLISPMNRVWFTLWVYEEICTVELGYVLAPRNSVFAGI